MQPSDSDSELQALLKFLYIAPVGIIKATLDGEITIINPMAANLLMPLQSDGILVNIFTALGETLSELKELVQNHRASSGLICKSLRLDPFYRAQRKAERQTYELTLIKVEANVLMAVLTDVTDIVKREEQIRLGAAWYTALLNKQLNYGVVDLDEHGLVLTWNAEMEKLTGFSESQILGKSCEALYLGESKFSKRLPDLLYEANQSGWTLQNDWCVTAGGQKFWSSYMIAACQSSLSDGRGIAEKKNKNLAKKAAFFLLLRDINDHADTLSQIIHANSSDHLTGLLNRRAFFDLAEIEIRRWSRTPRPLCLLAIDADFFKKVNDQFGHGVGDNVLKLMAEAFTACVRDTDVAARIGGEEFTVLLPHTELKDAYSLAERIRVAVESIVMMIGDHPLNLTVSIGIAEMSSSIKDVENLMQLADGALYRAKNLGRNRIEIASESRRSTDSLAPLNEANEI